MRKIGLDDIRAYVEAHIKTSLLNYNYLDKYIIEQVYYRASKCHNCLIAEECLDCECKLPERFFVDKKYQQCNFERLKNKEDWEEFKIQKNIDINELIEKSDERLKRFFSK